MFAQAHDADVTLADNEEMMVLWIGSDASPRLLKDLFDVDEFMQVDTHLVSRFSHPKV